MWTSDRAAPLRLTAIRHQAFGINQLHPELAEAGELFSERCAPYQVTVDPDRPLPGNRNSFSQMSADMIELLRDQGDPGLIVIAHATPDSDPSISIAGYLQHRLGGDPLVFAISDQGRVAPFTALRIAQDWARNGACRATAVIAADQATLAYADPALGHLDTAADHAVGLLLTTDGTVPLLAVRQLPATAPSQVGAVVADAVAEFGSVVPLIVVTGQAVGPGVVPAWTNAQARRVPGDQHCTALWSVVADELTGVGQHREGRPNLRPRGRVLAVDYEPALRLLSLAVFDPPPVVR